MKNRTYNNMLKATKLIVNKGYNLETANNIAINCFEQMNIIKNGMPVEWFIDKIQTLEQKREQYVY